MEPTSGITQTADLNLDLKPSGWNTYIACYKASGDTMSHFCEYNSLSINGQLRAVTPSQLRTAIQRQAEYGNAKNYDRRCDNPGRPVKIDSLMLNVVYRNALLFNKLSIEAHRKLLIDVLRREYAWSETDLRGKGVPRRRKIQRVLGSIPEFLTCYVEKGYKGLHEKMAPTGPSSCYIPGEYWVADTATLTRFKYFRNGRTVHPQVTSIKDAGSRLCVWAILHWDDATYREILMLLQKAILRSRRERKSDLWPSQGCPLFFRADQGPLCRNQFFHYACEQLGITVLHSLPNKPQGNGAAEKFVQILKNGFVPVLEQRMADRNLGQIDGVSHKLALFENNFLSLIEDYNQTASPAMDRLCPLQFFETHRPHQEINPRSEQEVIRATLVCDTRMLARGKFSYNNRVYCVAQSPLIGSEEVTIWVDPGEPWPEGILVEHDGKIVGVANPETNRFLPDIRVKPASVPEAVQIVHQFAAAVGVSEIPHPKSKRPKKSKTKFRSAARPPQPNAILPPSGPSSGSKVPHTQVQRLAKPQVVNLDSMAPWLRETVTGKVIA